MKLRNKKTGEIGYLRSINWNETAFIIMDKDGVQLAKYNSLAELNAEWCDYGEPKGFWMINILGIVEYTHGLPENEVEMMKAIGNYFSSREEAEKAVEKLKAWKRLKDNGFRFIPEFHRIEEGDDERGNIMFIACTMNDDKDFIYGDNKDLKLLFGGEE